MTDTVTLKRTCWACPEQYDAFIGSEPVGYLRLRHGRFTVRYPDVDGELIYSADPEGDGIFEDFERDYFLRFAVDAILRSHKDESAHLAPTNVDYEVVE